MSTIAKSLKDTNGNTVLPKTRSNWVYRNNEINVEDSLTSLENTTSSLQNQIQNGAASSSDALLMCSHEKVDTVHKLTTRTALSVNTRFLSFIAGSNFTSGDTFEINNVAYTPLAYDLSAPADLAFKSAQFVILTIDYANKQCFINIGDTTPGVPVEPPTEEPADEAASYTLFQAIQSTTTWTAPESKWYRILCFAKSGDGGMGGAAPQSGTVRYAGTGGAGGNCGGISVSTLYFDQGAQVNITVTDSLSSFGNYLSATAGGKGGNGTYSTTNVPSAVGQPSTIYGQGFGGNKINEIGPLGNGGSAQQYNSSSSIPWYSGGGGFGQLYTRNNYTSKYIALSYTQGTVIWAYPNIKLGGGGKGGQGGFWYKSDNNYWSGLSASYFYTAAEGVFGCPGIIIIEKQN